ncbi:MAG TPA: MMPL family transporter [Gemmatimonadales bacterium]|nr:MMPL family transporter [Gemmatimonadales bacterium]
MFESFGKALVRWRWAVIAAWAVIGVVAALRAGDTVERLELRSSAQAITEAREADALLTSRFARPIAEFFAVTVQGPSTMVAGQGGELLDALLATAKRHPGVSGTVSYRSTNDSTFVARDGRTTFFLVALDEQGSEVAKHVAPLRQAFDSVVRRFPDRDAYTVQVTGRAPLDLDIRQVTAEDASRNERKLIPITLAILVLAFGALVAAALPIIVGVMAIAIALAAVGVIATVMPMSIFVLNMVSMIGLGVGIDYSLLVVTRFREELTAGLRATEAAVRTFKTAGHAVVTSGATVVVGFGALLLTPLTETRSVGIAGLVVVAVAVALSTTLLPALLAVLGRQIDRPKWLASRLAWYHRPQIWERWARSLSRHPYRAAAIGTAIIALLTLPVLQLRIGLPSRHWWPEQTEAGAGVATLERMGMSGYIQPIRILVEFPEGTDATGATALRGLKRLSDTLRTDPRIRDVRSLVDLAPGTTLLEYSLLYSEPDTVRARYPDFLDAYLGTDGRITLVDVILADTTSLTTAMDVVEDVRGVIAGGSIRQLRNAESKVGGYVAGALDFQALLLERFPLVVALILGVTAVMLAIVFKSVLVPIKAVIMNSLSVAATFGLIVLVFQQGTGGAAFGISGPTDAIYVLVPILVFAVVFGLSMDYEVFLLARIKEAFDRTGQNTLATREGLSATASVITSAALIMIAVFGAFAFARILLMQFVGFGLAVAVLLDATIIRMVLVPSLMQIAGEWNWWPGWKRKKEMGDQ